MSVEELEVLGKKARNSILKGIIDMIIIVIILFLIHLPYIAPFAIIPGIAITLFASYGPTRTFRLAFKKTFVLKSLESNFTDLVYKSEDGLDESVIRKTGMMDMGDRYSSNDFIAGKYKNINVIQAYEKSFFLEK